MPQMPGSAVIWICAKPFCPQLVPCEALTSQKSPLVVSLPHPTIRTLLVGEVPQLAVLVMIPPVYYYQGTLSASTAAVMGAYLSALYIAAEMVWKLEVLITLADEFGY
jgi:hypothetical protein